MYWRRQRKYCVICQYEGKKYLKPLSHGLYCKEHRKTGRIVRQYYLDKIKERIVKLHGRRFIWGCKLRDRRGPESGKKILSRLEYWKERIKKEEDTLFRAEWVKSIVDKAKIQRQPYVV